MAVFCVVIGIMAADNPEAVSPGNEIRATVIDQVCPTFSWAQMPGATAYQIAVFEMSERYEGLSYYENKAGSSQPVLIKKISGSASSWTPSLEEALQNGGRYVWFVKAQDGYGSGSWSVGKKFAVRASLGLTEIREKIKEQLEAKGVKGDLVDEAFEGIGSQDMPPKEGGELKGKVKEEREYAAQSKVKTQENKEVQSKENLTAQGKSDFTARTLGSEGDSNNNVYYGTGTNHSLPGTASYNSFFGYHAGYNNNDGDRNTFLGYYAGSSNTTGGSNTFIGNSAGYSNTTGEHNTLMGYKAGSAITTASGDTFIGYDAGYSNTTASANTFIGFKTGYSNTTGACHTFMGNSAGYSNTTGEGNTFLGYRSGYSNSEGNYNAFIGYSAGHENTTGHDSIFMGLLAGRFNTTGSNNIFIGNYAGYTNSTASANTYIGYKAGYNTTGSSNVFLGYRAGYNETGSYRLYIDSSDTSSPLIYGEFDNELVTINGTLNVTESNINVDTASKRARFKLQADGNGTNTDDFFNFTMRNDKGDVTLSVWDDSASGWLPMLSYEYLNSKVDFKNNDIVTTGTISSGGGAYTSGGAWIEASSRDYKENIMELDQAESFQALASLNPVRYNYKNKKDEEFLGFIAEDVPDLVAMNSRKGMRAMDIVAVLTKVAQEQQQIINEQKKLLNEQNETNEKQDKLINALLKRIKKLEEKPNKKQ